MPKTKVTKAKVTIKSTKKTNKTKKPYIPITISLSEYRETKEYNDVDIVNFLNNKPSKEQMNKLYDTTMYFAKSDSIGEGWSYVDEFTRQEFNILCKIIKSRADEIIRNEVKSQQDKVDKEIELEYKINKNDKNYNKIKKTIDKLKHEKYPNYKQIEKDYLITNNILSKEEYDIYKIYMTIYIDIAYDLLHHLRVLN
jgi:hypothetical protein